MFFNVKPVYNQQTGELDLYAKQGTTWRLVITLRSVNGKPVDLSTIQQIRGQIRKKYNDNSFVKNFVCSVLDAENGKILISLSAQETASIPAGNNMFSVASRYVYDIELVDEHGNVYRILQGKIFVDPEVTK